MAVVQIGRFGQDDNVDVASWDDSGASVRVSGDYIGSSVAVAKAARRQLTGYVDSADVLHVPVVWSEDDTVDGFYRVASANVSTVQSSLTSGYFEWSVELVKAPGLSSPLLESGLVGDVRDNAHSITSADNWLAVPDAYRTMSYSSASVATVAAESGDVALFYRSVSAAFDESWVWTVAPADFYDGAARLQEDVGSSTWRDVVGRNIRDVGTGWRVDNGLVRVTEGASNAELDVAHWDGTSWESKEYNISTGTYSISSPAEVAVLRNTPERVTVRLTYPLVFPSVNAPTTVDVSVRRGSRTVELNVQLTQGYTDTITVGRSATEASTAITAGIRATSDDADGNRFVLLAPGGLTADTTNGRLTTSASVASARFGIGSEVGGSSAAADWTATDLRDRYMAAMDETVRVVTR